MKKWMQDITRHVDHVATPYRSSRSVNASDKPTCKTKPAVKCMRCMVAPELTQKPRQLRRKLTKEQRPTPTPRRIRPTTSMATSTAPAKIPAPTMKKAPATMLTGCSEKHTCYATLKHTLQSPIVKLPYQNAKQHLTMLSESFAKAQYDHTYNHHK